MPSARPRTRRFAPPRSVAQATGTRLQTAALWCDLTMACGLEASATHGRTRGSHTREVPGTLAKVSHRISHLGGSDASKSGQIRLYANCHVVSWDASVTELARMRAYLDANWSANLQEACREFCDLDGLLGKESFSAT